MKIFREPLVHFLLLGAMLFILFQIWGKSAVPGSGTSAAKRIDVDPQRIALIRHTFEIDNGEPPTAAELERAIHAWVREEILVREARAQGLDLDDSTIRRKLVQTMEFHTEPAPPTDDDLRAYVAKHPEEFITGLDKHLPPLAEIRSQVAAAWMAEHRQLAIGQMYERYRAQYDVHIAPVPATATKPATEPR